MESIEEVFTGTIGFVIAMAIIGLALGLAVYGYYAYVQNQVLANYLWPVVDVVPYGSGYYVAVINTGHEPFFIKTIFFSDGSHLNVESRVLHHNEAWFYEVSELPSAVMVCSAVKPSVCVIAKSSGWSLIVWPSPLIVSVVDGPSAAWLITWPNGTANGYSTASFKIYATGPTTLNAYVTGVPQGYETCSITPSQTTASPGQSVTFQVTCQTPPSNWGGSGNNQPPNNGININLKQPPSNKTGANTTN
ncbi:hypothetical protein [Vulcanisaeta distributa]|uniref:hypothetical protein n=1 Tax=Vulcanisaeta distributa TaxID=164451 RepID=UPI000A95B0A9|nr:hypothetical protein [Vulcanisaeta distributa]